jgi:hypothetical protein
MRPILRRLALAVLVAAVLAYPVYLVAGNAYLRGGGLERLLNRRPERLWMHWASAWTSWPGVVHVRGFAMRSQSAVFQWWLAVDRATMDVDLLGLRGQELRIGPLHGSGVVFRLRRRLDAPPRRVPPQPELYPLIPGFSDPPVRKPETIYPEGPPRPHWHMRFTGVDLDDVREVWIEEYRFAGRARVAGGFDAVAQKRLEVMPARVEFLSGGFSMGALGAGPRSSPILLAASGRVDGRIEPYRPDRYRGWDVFRFITGRAELHGRVTSLDFLDVFLRQTRWVDLKVGPGTLRTDVRVRRGDLLAGSRLEARPDGVSLGFLDYRVAGFGGVTWSVERAAGRAGGREGRVALVLDQFRIQRQGYPRPHVRGRGLRIDAVSAAPRFGALFVPERLIIDMPRADVPDLTFYNAYLPRRSPVTVTSGSGWMSGRFAAVAPEWKGGGDFRLAARGVEAVLERKRMRGSVDIHSRLRMSLEDRRYDVSGSDVALSDVTLLDGTAAGVPWWARVHLDRAVIAPRAPVFLRARIESTLSDSRPLFALFAPVERSRVLRWVDRLVDIRGIGATADLTVGQGFLDVSHLAIAGGKAELLARLRFTGPRRQGILYASYGVLNVGLELEGAKRDWKILHAKQWFDSYPPFH